MKVLLFVSCLLLWAFQRKVNAQDYYQPEQLHLSYPDDPTQMYVTWSTMYDTNSSICEYGTSSLELQAEGYSTLFTDGGEEQRSQTIHRVTLTDLTPGQRYWYHCGSMLGWSELFFFKAMTSGVNWSPKFALFGDMGNDNAQSLPYLQEETQRGTYDAILHIGDFAYDMDTHNGEVGDQFMRQIQPIAAYTPYMTCPGNHEQLYNFSNYKNRFTMPHSEDSMFYSFDIGPVHFISISTEFYFFLNYGIKQILNQYKWLENDLKQANLQENRAKRPWIIAYGHRPMYCSNNDGDDCTHKESIVRVGIPLLKWYGLENMFYNYGVDLALWAHEHSYERLWPIFDYKLMNGSTDEPYTDPKAPVHVTTGSAGCSEQHDEFKAASPYWTAYRSINYGYTRMQVFNSSHLYMEQVAVDKGGEIIDSIWIIKSKHGSFSEMFPEEPLA